MPRNAGTWRAAHRLLRERADGAPALLRAAAAVEIGALPFSPRTVRTIVTTGLGSSAAHAKLLAHLLAELGLPARFVPTGALGPNARLHEARQGSSERALIVFSQGLSPNARVALRAARAWVGVIVVTAVERSTAGPDTRTVLDALDAAGGLRVALPGGAERGTLLRIAGPLAGYAIAFRLAAAIGRAAGRNVDALGLDVARIGACVAAAATRAQALCAGADPFTGVVALLASGGYGELADNLRLKVGEALFEPLPPVCDLLELAHGPFQALHARQATIIALTRGDAADEPALLARAERMLVPTRHRFLRLPAELSGARALFEHETLLNELVLAAIAARQLDQADWPGRGRDAPLYDVADVRTSSEVQNRSTARLASDVGSERDVECAAQRRSGSRTASSGAMQSGARAPHSTSARSRRPPSAELATLTWPDVDRALAAGIRTAVVPLGSTEQHGPHLPFATDTLIADALAERLCARIGALHVPALALGCAAEHGGFAGSLSLRWDTLHAVLLDVVGSLASHGFDTVFIFTAHGGNAALLRQSAPALAVAGQPAAVLVCADLDALTAVFHRASAAAGVAAAASGHHAGEFETSILLSLQPDLVRRAALQDGLVELGPDPQAVFYPDLRAHAPSGVVGDPRCADPARGAAYLDAWVDHLVDCCRRALA